MSTETVIITPLSAEDGGGFLATIPSMPGCMSDGETEVDEFAKLFAQSGQNLTALAGQLSPPP